MTVLFTATTAVCLALLAALALQIDLVSRSDQLTADVSERAAGLARAVYFDAGSLRLEPLGEDELARGAEFLVVARTGVDAADGGLLYRSASAAAGIDDGLLDDLFDGLVADVIESQGAVHEMPPMKRGSAVAWAGAPVWTATRSARWCSSDRAPQLRTTRTAA